jgi:hypothetical protein
MKKLLAPLVFAALISGSGLVAFSANAETVIPDSEAAQHVGQTVLVEGTITKVKVRPQRPPRSAENQADPPEVSFLRRDRPLPRRPPYRNGR